MTVRLPRRDGSSVLLIGTSKYVSPDLPDLPAVRNNLAGLAAALTDPRYGGIQPVNCRIIDQPASPLTISRAVRELARAADDTLIVYFAGHGIAGRTSGELFLALPESDPEDPALSALRYDDLRNLLVASGFVRAKTRVVILDCCFSGRAIPTMSSAQVGGLVEIDGVYVLTATARNQPALAPEGERYTAFSGALLELLRNGIADGPELLSLGVIHEQLNGMLRARDLPRPEQVNYRSAAQLALTRNPAYRPAPITPPPQPPAVPANPVGTATMQPLPAMPQPAPQRPLPPLPPSQARSAESKPPIRPVKSATPAKKANAARPSSRVRRRGGAVVTTPLGLLGRGVIALWMGVAHGVGWTARVVGRQAASTRDLDPEHRRDGGGLALICLAVLFAAALWFRTPDPVTSWLATAMRLTFGALANALPVLLLLNAVARMRSTPDEDNRGRGIVGWAALFIGGAGLAHIAAGRPARSPAQDEAGGLLGRFGGGTIDAALTPWIALPLLILLSLFGLLVVTATPISRIPHRWRQLRDLALGRVEDPILGVDEEFEEIYDEPEPRPARRSPAHRRQAAALPHPLDDPGGPLDG
ncbi:DNA translocase FtsK 4TM domain-containing protein [Dactylosporangium sp. NPDC049140]|uniref:DNA translocase FtsK 4TM domain-containing protein n=1 Tax=Dactylosporangium sp. NPDC049140 TaxID=3155647 RepID=UPI0033E6D221